MSTLTATTPDFLDRHTCTLKRTWSPTMSACVLAIQSTQHLFEMPIDLIILRMTDISALSQHVYVLEILWSSRSLSLWFPFATTTSKRRWYCVASSYWIAPTHR